MFWGKDDAFIELMHYLRELIEFIRRYLQQLSSSLTSTPCENLCSLICKSDFQVESACNFITITKTETAFINPTGNLLNYMTAKRM